MASSSRTPLTQGSSSSRSNLVLTAEEERVLIRNPDSLQFQEDGSFLVSEERIFQHFRDPVAPPMLLYLSKPKMGERRRIESSLEKLTVLPFANPVTLIGHSLGLVCFRDPRDSMFYVFRVATEEIVEVIPEDVGRPRPGFSTEAAYGFGHTHDGSFKIVRFPFWSELESHPDGHTHFHVYHSLTRTWVTQEFRQQPLFKPWTEPEPEPALLCPEHCCLFWKVRLDGISRVISYDLNVDTLSTVIRRQDIIREICDRNTDFLKDLSFGPGCKGQIIGCKLTMISDFGHVELFTLHFRVNKWTLVRHSRFDLSLPPDTVSLRPLTGLSDADHQLQFLFFLRNHNNVMGIKFDQFDGWMWHPTVNFTLHLIGIQGSQPPTYSAIAMGPRIIPMERDEDSDDSNPPKFAARDGPEVPPQQPFSFKAQARAKKPSRNGKEKSRENTRPSRSKGSSKTQEQSTFLLRQGISQNGLKSARYMSSKPFVGGLSISTDDNSLKEAFSGFGDVTDGYISQAAKLETHGTPACPSFSLEELKEATKDFDFSTCLGEGCMGKIYKGKLENGTSVAIRSLAISKKCSTQNLKVQLDLLSKLHHPHLVVLLGHCIDCSGQDDSGGNRLFLVYEYISGGNYRTYLSENYPEKVLKWPDRLAILIGVAKAVHFLHTGVIPGSFNNRLKTNNILLDEHRIPKLSDYGMSIITEETVKLEAKGEGPKSCCKNDLEGDVYNFGFILLESLVGPRISGMGEAFVLNEMASFRSQDGRRRTVDPIVLTTCSLESLSIVVSITKKCISPEVSTRPSFEDVLWNLQHAAQVQATADADQKSEATI